MINEENVKAVERERLVLAELKRLQGFAEKLSGRFSNIEDRLLIVSSPIQEFKSPAQPPHEIPVVNDLMNCNNKLDELCERMSSVLDRLEL